MSHGLCTLSHVSYATQPRYCRNYALKIYDARRNRRNAPSVARFSLPCHPWQGISVYRVHNSTVSRQLRYSLTRESVPAHTLNCTVPLLTLHSSFFYSQLLYIVLICTQLLVYFIYPVISAPDCILYISQH